MIVLDDREKASLQSGSSFYREDLSSNLPGPIRLTAARQINGGYVGDLEASQLDPAWSAAALKLQPGEISDVVEANEKYVIVQRMPRNFREDAQAIFDKAMELRKQGKQQEAINGLLEALKIYPASSACADLARRSVWARRQSAR